MDSILVYPGGKASIVKWICEGMPAHKICVDLCGGGASFTLYKPESEVEVYNDIGMVALFFAILRTTDAGPILYEKLRLSPMSEDEFQFCHERWQYEEEPIEQCRMWFVQLLQCFTHEEAGTGWIGVGKEVSQGKSYRNHVDAIPAFVERFRGVQITNRRAIEIIDIYDTPDTLFYFDPPYRNESGGDVQVGYMNPMSIKEHEQTIDKLSIAKGQVMISGYDNPLYERLIGHWEKKTYKRTGMIKNNKQTSTEREECLWTKRNTLAIHNDKKVVHYGDNLTLW